MIFSQDNAEEGDGIGIEPCSGLVEDRNGFYGHMRGRHAPHEAESLLLGSPQWHTDCH